MGSGLPPWANRTSVIAGAAVAVVIAVVVVSFSVRGGPVRSAPAPSAANRSVTALPAALQPEAPAGPATGPAAEPGPPAETGTALVRLDAPAAADPRATTVAQLLDRHFAAINAKDYDGWAGTVVSRRATDQSRESWLHAYRSTTDESVVVTNVTATSSGLAVGLTFVSNQDRVDAPSDVQAERICWSSTWPLVDTADGLRIGIPQRGATSKHAC